LTFNLTLSLLRAKEQFVVVIRGIKEEENSFQLISGKRAKEKNSSAVDCQ
jgi:hypothetical protein